MCHMLCDSCDKCCKQLASTTSRPVNSVVVPLLVAYLCWRPDLLLCWRAAPGVHTPSYTGYLRQLKQQRSAAKKARQAAQQADSSSGSRQWQDSRIEVYWAYVVHLFMQCWCARAYFAVLSMLQQFVVLCGLPGRLVVLVLCLPWQVLAAAASVFKHDHD